MKVSAETKLLPFYLILGLVLSLLALPASQALAATTPGDGVCDLSFEQNGSPPNAGSATDPYLVGSLLELREIMDCDGAGKHFKQTQNIAASGSWSPLGSTVSPFMGTYDGGGNSITAIEINTYNVVPTPGGNNQYLDGIGLFVAVRDALLKNLALDVTVDITSGTTSPASVENVAAVAGWADNSEFENLNIDFKAGITAGAGSLSRVGGVVGRGAANIGQFSTTTGTAKLVFRNVSVNMENSVASGSNAGGLVANAILANGGILRISNSSVVMSNTGSGTVDLNTGGLVGILDLVSSMHSATVQVEDSFTRGTLRLQKANTTRVGGMFGNVGVRGGVEVINSYTAFRFTNFNTQTSISPLVGNFFRESTNTFSGVVWDSSITTASSSVGLPETNANMRSVTTFANLGWSISEGYEPTSRWGIHPAVNEGYPFLTGNYSSDPTPTAPTYNSATAFNLVTGTEAVATLTSTPSAQWVITSDPSGLFSIDSITGEMTVSSTASVGSYPVTVRFTGSNSGFGSQVITVNVMAPPAPQTSVGAAPVVINTPEISQFSKTKISAAGDEVTATGLRLSGITTLTLGGITVTIVSSTDTTLIFSTGEMPIGVWDLRLVGANGTLVYQSAIEVVETAVVAESTGELIGWSWTLRFFGNERSLNEPQEDHLRSVMQKNAAAETVICWGYTTAANPKPWAIAHATARAKAACDYALGNNSAVKTIVRLRYGVPKDFAMRAALQFWK